MAHPSLPVSMGCSLAERVHITLGGGRNSIPVHGSYQGVRASLQQQTNQFKISCKPREGGLIRESSKHTVTDTSRDRVLEPLAGTSIRDSYLRRLRAGGAFLSSSPRRAPQSPPPWPRRPGGAVEAEWPLRCFKDTPGKAGGNQCGASVPALLWVHDHVHRGRATASQRVSWEPLTSPRASDHSNHSNCGPRTVASASPGSLFEMLVLRLHPRTND